MTFCPFFVPAGSLGKMAGLRLHDTQVAFGQGFETWVTVPLCKTLAGFPAAFNTMNIAGVLQSEWAAELIV